jgi:hypothetical protein
MTVYTLSRETKYNTFQIVKTLGSHTRLSTRFFLKKKALWLQVGLSGDPDSDEYERLSQHGKKHHVHDAPVDRDP